MSEPLKPCPLCGGKAYLDGWMEEAEGDYSVVALADDAGMVNWHQVSCDDCDAEMPAVCEDETEAIRRWNAWSGEPPPG